MFQSQMFGKYRIIRLLGEGATSKVYLAMHEVLQQYRAIKCISKSYISYEQVREETDLLNQFKSPAIPIVYDIEEDQDYLYIIEEYMEGESLLSYRNRMGHLTESSIIEFALQICNLISYLHSRKNPILYLDLKPSNLIVHENCIKLIDFGVARYKHSVKPHCNYGTRGFAAPEQYFMTDVSEKSDIYGVGMLMYFLMSGSIHMNSNVLPNIQRRHEYSVGLCRLVTRSIKHNPCERFLTMQIMKYNLLRLNRQDRKRVQLHKNTKRIAIVGASPKSGVSHLAFSLMAYFKEVGSSCIYVECNTSNVVSTLALGNKSVLDQVVLYQGYYLTRAEWYQEEKERYEYIIYDYGTINPDCLEQFLRADISLCVFGGMPWELTSALNSMRMLTNAESVKYIVNHLEARDFYKLVRKISVQRVFPVDQQIFRMPMQCNPWTKVSANFKELVKNILE